MIEKVLEEITFNTRLRTNKLSICTPSQYSNVFIEELRKVSSDENDINEAEKILTNKKMAEFEERLLSSENILTNSENILINAISAINEERKDELNNLKDQMASMISQLHSLSDEIYTDELTKAFNRKWLFKTKLADEENFKENGTMVFIDLNDFKIINDTYGHHTGDKSLIFISNFIKVELKKLRIENELMRFGGDEFIIFFKETNVNLSLIMEQIQDGLDKKRLIDKTLNESFKMGFSFGLAVYKTGESIHDVMSIADTKMYNQKKFRKSKR